MPCSYTIRPAKNEAFQLLCRTLWEHLLKFTGVSFYQCNASSTVCPVSLQVSGKELNIYNSPSRVFKVSFFLSWKSVAPQVIGNASNKKSIRGGEEKYKPESYYPPFTATHSLLDHQLDRFSPPHSLKPET